MQKSAQETLMDIASSGDLADCQDGRKTGSTKIQKNEGFTKQHSITEQPFAMESSAHSSPPLTPPLGYPSALLPTVSAVTISSAIRL